MLRQAKVYTTRLSEAEDAAVWQELANNREAVTEGSQGQPRSGAAPGTCTIQFSPERATDDQVLTSKDPRSAALSGLNISVSHPGAAPLRGCPWLPSIAPSVLLSLMRQSELSRNVGSPFNSDKYNHKIRIALT
jgi:hypothetical protein